MRKVELQNYLFDYLDKVFEGFELVSFEHTEGHPKYHYTAVVMVKMGRLVDKDTYYVVYEKKNGIEKVYISNLNEILEVYCLN